MKYRVPIANEIIDIPTNLVLSERERIVLQYDVRAYEDDQDDVAHWEYVASLIENELGWEETASSVRSVKDRMTRRVRKAALVSTVNSDLSKNIVFRERETDVTQRKALFQQWMGTDYDSDEKQRGWGEKPFRTVLALGDYHGSVNPNVAEYVLANAGLWDVIVSGGDLLDSWGLHQARLNGESLTMQEREIYLDKEIQNLRAWCETLDEATHAKHVVIQGNHDSKAEKAFIRLLGPLLREESLMVRMFRTPLQLITEGLESCELARQEMLWHYPSGRTDVAGHSKFQYVLGDAYLSHQNFTGGYPGAASQKLWQWIQEHRIPLNLSHIRLAVQFHTHKMSMSRMQGGDVCLVEPGTALDAPALGYQVSYQAKWRPTVTGCCIFQQYLADDVWVTDLKSVELKELG